MPCLPPGDLLNPGIKPTFLTSPALEGRFFTPTAAWELASKGWRPGMLLSIIEDSPQHWVTWSPQSTVLRRRDCPEASSQNTVGDQSNAHLCRTVAILCSFPWGTLPHFVLTVAWEVSSEPSFYTQEREGQQITFDNDFRRKIVK